MQMWIYFHLELTYSQAMAQKKLSIFCSLVHGSAVHITDLYNCLGHLIK